MKKDINKDGLENFVNNLTIGYDDLKEICYLSYFCENEIFRDFYQLTLKNISNNYRRWLKK